MQLPWDDHFFEIVVPAWQTYLLAETELSQASISKDSERISRASYTALREGGAATFYVHHFADIVMRARPDWLPNHIKNLTALRIWLSEHCTMLRTEAKCNDIQLVGDVADALKHAILTHRPEFREVLANEAVLVSSTGYGDLRFGEGSFGGVEQILVLGKSEARALSSVLQNVIDAWRRAAHIDLPEIGKP